MIVLLCIGGPETVGAGIRERNSELLPFLNMYDDWDYGMGVIIILFMQMMIELFLGWSCRRKSTRPEKLLLTLVLSGIRILTSLYTLLKSGMDINILMDAGYTLLLNLLTFFLAFRIRREHGGILRIKK